MQNGLAWRGRSCVKHRELHNARFAGCLTQSGPWSFEVGRRCIVLEMCTKTFKAVGLCSHLQAWHLNGWRDALTSWE